MSDDEKPPQLGRGRGRGTRAELEGPGKNKFNSNQLRLAKKYHLQEVHPADNQL
jgi:hypothetical protein